MDTSIIMLTWITFHVSSSVCFMLRKEIHRKSNCDQIRKLLGEHGIQFNLIHFKQIFTECLLGRMRLTAGVIKLLLGWASKSGHWCWRHTTKCSLFLSLCFSPPLACPGSNVVLQTECNTVDQISTLAYCSHLAWLGFKGLLSYPSHISKP